MPNMSRRMAQAVANERYARQSGDPDRIEGAHRARAVVSITEHIERVTRSAPPLKPEEVDCVVSTLRTAGARLAESAPPITPAAIDRVTSILRTPMAVTS